VHERAVFLVSVPVVAGALALLAFESAAWRESPPRSSSSSRGSTFLRRSFTLSRRAP